MFILYARFLWGWRVEWEVKQFLREWGYNGGQKSSRADCGIFDNSD